MTPCGDNDCQGLHDLKADFATHRQELKRDYARHQILIAGIVTLGSALFGAMTQWQIARLNKAPAQPSHTHPYVIAGK
jgi:hypothetical protein